MPLLFSLGKGFSILYEKRKGFHIKSTNVKPLHNKYIIPTPRSQENFCCLKRGKDISYCSGFMKQVVN